MSDKKKTIQLTLFGNQVNQDVQKIFKTPRTLYEQFVNSYYEVNKDRSIKEDIVNEATAKYKEWGEAGVKKYMNDNKVTPKQV